MFVGNGLRDGEAQACAARAGAGGVRAEERLGEARKRFGRDAGTLVCNLDVGFARFGAADFHHAAAAVLGGVLRKIAQRARDLARAAVAR